MTQKKFENHTHMVAIYAVWYNWVHIHKSLHVTPTIAAGLSETVMDWAELWRRWMADAPTKKRGPYKKTAKQISNLRHYQATSPLDDRTARTDIAAPAPLRGPAMPLALIAGIDQKPKSRIAAMFNRSPRQ